MQLITGISVVTMAASIAAVALVLWLVVTEPWEPDAQSETPVVQSANEEHTRELDGDMLGMLIREHANQLIESKGLRGETLREEGDDFEILRGLPGYKCFWGVPFKYPNNPRVKEYTGIADITGYALGGRFLNYHYSEKDDIWLVTSVKSGCENNLETWTIDDNTGAITYGRLP